MKFDIKKPNVQLPEVKLPNLRKASPSRLLTEEDVLKKLNIPDWRHMSKDKIMSFTSSLPDMDPEVAMAAINKFPDYVNMCADVLSNINNAMNSILDHADKTSKPIIEAYKSQITILQDELKKEDFTLEDKFAISDRIMDLIEKMKDIKEHDDKQAKELFDKVLGLAAGGLTLAVALIGVNINKK